MIWVLVIKVERIVLDASFKLKTGDWRVYSLGAQPRCRCRWVAGHPFSTCRASLGGVCRPKGYTHAARLMCGTSWALVDGE